jgi:hypothetical protein
MADINRLGPERVRRSLFRSRVGDCVRRQSAGSCVFCARMLLRSRIGIKANTGGPTRARNRKLKAVANVPQANLAVRIRNLLRLCHDSEIFAYRYRGLFIGRADDLTIILVLTGPSRGC